MNATNEYCGFRNAHSRAARFQELYDALVAKRNRLEELKRIGRYGYQLRMPRVALNRAAKALKAEFPDEAKMLGIY